MQALTFTDISIRLGTALLCGGLLGLERERKNRPAGFRTMILISLGSAGFILTGEAAIVAYASSSGTVVGAADISRVLQGLMGGVGFLGAGAVIQNKKAVRGLTTAAAVWVTACVGAMAGLGLFMLAGVLSAMTLFTLIVLEHVEHHYFPDQNDEDDKRKQDANVIQIVLDRDGKQVSGGN